MLDKINQYIELYDAYKELLTKKQRTYLELYFHEDLSLAEIADEFGVSRNAVFDNIKRTQKLLTDYEERLQLTKKSRDRQVVYQKLLAYVTDNEIVGMVEQLKGLE